MSAPGRASYSHRSLTPDRLVLVDHGWGGDEPCGCWWSRTRSKMARAAAPWARAGGLRGRRRRSTATTALLGRHRDRTTTPSCSTSCCPAWTASRSAGALRERGRWAPVLMLTARDGSPTGSRGLDAGADDYLVKPFALRGAAGPPAGAHPPRAGRAPARCSRVGDLVLDPAARIVTRAGESRSSCRPREFALLEFLMRHAGAGGVAARELLEHVWDYELRRPLQRRRRLRRLPAPQARAARRPPADPHRPRGRLRARCARSGLAG